MSPADLHRRFAEQAGSDRIATPRAIAGLRKWYRRARPRSILEVGSGIGTLTYTALSLARRLGDLDRLRFVAIEDSDFCREKLTRNLGDLMEHVVLVRHLPEVPAGELFDLIVVDGGRKDDPSYFHRVARGGTVYFEGWRLQQRRLLETTLGERPFVRTHCKPLGRKSPGYWIYRFEPRVAEVLAFRARNAVNHLDNRRAGRTRAQG